MSKVADRFLINNVSICGEDPHADRNPCLLSLEACLDRLPEDVVIELIEKTVVHIPSGIPAVLTIHVPLNIIVLPESMERWSLDARVGAIAHEFAHVVAGNSTDGSANALARSWGFEREIEASRRQREDEMLAVILTEHNYEIAVVENGD